MNTGRKFKLKSNVSDDDLIEIDYGEDSIEWIRDQNYFMSTETPKYHPEHENKIWYFNGSCCGMCYFTLDMVQFIDNHHPLTNIFKLDAKAK